MVQASTPPVAGSYMAPLAAAAPEFAKAVGEVREQMLAPSALDSKTKSLILAALDIACGLPDGARTMFDTARKTGATEAEIVDVLKVVYTNGGAQRLVAGLRAIAPRT